MWVLLGLTVAAVALRIWPLTQSMYGDELFFYWKVHNHSLGDTLSLARDDENTPPLGFVLGWLFDQGAYADRLVRIPSFAAGIALVPLTYVLGRKVADRFAGLFAATLLTFSSFQIFYSSESRVYEQLSMLLVASTLFLLQALQTRNWRWWAAFVITITVAIYSHYNAALTLVPQAAWALWFHRDQVRSIALAHGLAALAWVPWVPSFLHQLDRSSAEAASLNDSASTTVKQIATIVFRAVGGHPFLAPHTLPGRAAVWMISGAMAVAVTLALVEVARRAPRPRVDARSGLALVALLALAPLVGHVVYSLRPNTSFLIARNVMGSVPYVLVLMGLALATVRPRLLGPALATLVLAGVGLGTIRMEQSRYQRPDVRAAAQEIAAKAGPGASVINGQVLYTELPHGQALNYYLRGVRIYKANQTDLAWRRAAAANASVALAAPAGAAVLFAIPPDQRRRYRLAYERTTPGLSTGLIVRIWRPRS